MTDQRLALQAEHGAAARHPVSDGQIGIIHHQDGRRHLHPGPDRLVSAQRAPTHDLLRSCGICLSHLAGDRQVRLSDRRAVFSQIANELGMYRVTL